jgi:sodium/potassium/calcium exchanger 6
MISIWCLGSTSDSYLSPALEAISDKFKCSESLAGVTLLALGNGAPDVFSAIAAGGDSPENGDVLLSVSGLMGSCLFITTVVMYMSVNATGDAKTIRVTKRFFLRDLLFLFLTCVYLIIAMLVYGKLDIYLSSGLLVMYLVFVIIVVI